MVGLYALITAVLFFAVWAWLSHRKQLRQLRETMVELRQQNERYEKEIATIERQSHQQQQQFTKLQQNVGEKDHLIRELQANHANALTKWQTDLADLEKRLKTPVVQATTQASDPKPVDQPEQNGLQGLVSSPKANKVFALMERGESQAAIARKCDLQVSEVLLIMGLKKFIGKSSNE